jgi:hypothetical protein
MASLHIIDVEHVESGKTMMALCDNTDEVLDAIRELDDGFRLLRVERVATWFEAPTD